ncbi:MAG TPA: bifunctional DNA-formamidopyrimidine glycosylase/DNA-(apurinic or apyrimidinic site) lyase [Burkholderiaceae bacterium]|nr:bifunctional DNA-formamidopyrimidine glycosylase/DNA-(apurinic or apyrimidinic site) lyase [Burkholderiaceae bacterium]
MPELPEVEVTARALARRFDGQRVTAVRIYNRQLRWRISESLAQCLTGERIEHISRRGKYLLWYLRSGVLISHLGMSGSWRVHEARCAPARERHDHVEVECNGAIARLNDPRRFGALLWHAHSCGDVLRHPLLAHLGVEPFDPRFDGDWLFAATRGRRSSIKQVLLAGKTVVGVGNIYATESLFAARIHPQTRAGRITRRRYVRLAAAIRAVLAQAIDLGGSTLRDFRGADGVNGRYTDFAQAYGRQGRACVRCGTPIRRLVLGQRATYFCPRCQRP